MGVTWKISIPLPLDAFLLTVHLFLYFDNLYKIGYKTPKKRAPVSRYGLF